MEESDRLTDIIAWKKEAPENEWERVQQMRKENHPLILGGQSALITDSQRRQYGIPNKRIVY